MPIYEYECVKCGHSLEAMQKFTDPVLTDCPACHEAGLRKRISAPAFHLKGSGWYVTDFKDKPKDKDKAKPVENNKQSAETTANEPDKTGTKTTSTESTPAAQKTETTTTE